MTWKEAIGLAIKLFLFVILCLGVFYLFGFASIRKHEGIHQKVFSTYGINSTIEIDYVWLEGVVIPDKKSPGECNDFCLMQHRFNDIVFYNFVFLVFNLWAMFLIYIVFKFWFEFKWK